MKFKSWLKNFVVIPVLSCALLFISMSAFAQQPVAKFSGTTLSGCAPILVQFTDESTGTPNYWKWDLGNGTISYLQHPSVTYFVPGIYSVKLLVKNVLGQDSIVKANYVQVYASPAVNFNASVTTACNTLTANFTNQSSAGHNWQWDFGDGIFSDVQNPAHTYSQTGNYNVSLKVINSDGCTATLLKRAYISVNNVKAAFANTVSSKCSPKKVSFQNNSTGNGRLVFKWLFGNGDSSVVQNPEYTYAAGGNYTVKLTVQNEFGCEDIISKTITVENPVSADFTADITKACKAPVAIHFTNQLLSGNNYYWDFGDTTFSPTANPVHQYTDTGKYSVKLLVKNNNGCIDSVTKTGYVNIQKPFVSFDNLPDSGCTPFAKKLIASTNGPDSVISYYWSFGDGQTSAVAAPTHVYTSQGYYTVSLVTTGISGCRDTSTMVNAIRAGSKPAAAFTAGSRIGCAQTGINFIDMSTGGATQWQWDFGDNSQAVEQNPKHTFTDTGFLSVQLIAFNGGCSDTLRLDKYVYIKPAVAKFKYDFTCAAPFTFAFHNYSIGADSWQWNFGDGNTSTAVNPIHTYSDTGMYSVSLVTFNQATGCEFLQTKMLKAVKIRPSFFAADTIACKNREIRFTATIASGDASRFIWNFGDGIIENTRENFITHIYDRPGNFTVQLITINLVNCRDTVIKTNYINVNGLKADFGLNNAAACINTTVQFNDSSFTEGANIIQSWQWNFGDGHIETMLAPPFTHTYNNRGNFPVSLKVTDNKGCSDQFVIDVPLAIKKINPLFWAADTVKCINSSIRFACPYAEHGVIYNWDFGDGSNADVQSPVHLYAHEGDYTVKLKIADANGCADSSTHINYISVQDPVAKFTMSDSFRTCPPLIVQFTNQSANAMDEVWDFGDGSITTTHTPSHFYSYPGTYTVSLTVNGRGGCSSKMQKQIVVKGPRGSLSYTPLNFCKPGEAIFTAHTTDAVSYIWDFNDGATTINNDSVVVHHYSNTGNYVPKLLLADNSGCKVPISGADTIHVVNLAAGFEFANTKICSQDHVDFVNTSTGSEKIVNNSWDFGDGFYANNIAEPSHDYQTAGTYYPLLVVKTASGCADSFTTAVPVKVVASPNAVIQSAANGCTPLTASFTASANTSVTPVAQWQWDFGNGSTSAQQIPAAQVYSNAGIYTITLKITSDEGCEKVITKTIEAYPLPSIQFSGNTNICKGSATALTASGASTYTWSPAAGLSCTGCASTLATPLLSSVYVVTGVNNFGCVASDSIVVNVAQPFSMNYSSNAKLCAGKSATLAVSGAAAYEWSPSTGLDDIHAAAPVAQPSATTIYRVIGTGPNGCYKDTGFVTVQVNALPLIDAGTDKSITAGTSVDLVPAVSADVTQLRWSPTDAVFRNNGNAITVKPAVTTEYTVEVKNTAGCTAIDKVNVVVAPAGNSGGLFIPNTFSPNGDGVNEIFYPRAAGSIKINKLRIFNRDGVVVFEKNNFYANDAAGGWDGTARGMKLPSDIYMYAVDVAGDNGQPHVISGNVSLLR